jgi:hypothetical protein
MLEEVEEEMVTHLRADQHMAQVEQVAVVPEETMTQQTLLAYGLVKREKMVPRLPGAAAVVAPHLVLSVVMVVLVLS